MIGRRKGIVTCSFAPERQVPLMDSGYLPSWLDNHWQALFSATDKRNMLDLETRQMTEPFSVVPRQLQFLRRAGEPVQQLERQCQRGRQLACPLAAPPAKP